MRANRLMRGTLTALAALLTTVSCAQLLGTDEFEVNPAAFADDDDGDASMSDDEDRDDGGASDDPADDDPADDDPTDDDPAGDDPTDDDPAGDDPANDDPAGDDPATDDATDDQSGEPDASMADDDDSPEAEASVDDAPDEAADSGTDDDLVPPDDGTDASDDPPADEAGPPGDVCPLPALGECSTIPQCGCDDGEMCLVTNFATGETSCRPAGTVEPYSPCVYVDECQPGYTCMGSVCRELCTGEEEFCEQGPYARCIQGETEDGPAVGVFACLLTCDPVDPTRNDATYSACGPGSNCNGATNGESFCYGPAGTGTQDAPCGTAEAPDPFACAESFTCVLHPDGPRCAASCEVGSNDCGDAGECQAFTPRLFSAEREVGYCGAVCPAYRDAVCNPLEQCGCSAGEMCSIVDFATGELACITEGTVPTGGSCASTGLACEAGNECLHWRTTGVCTLYCDAIADCQNPNGACVEVAPDAPSVCLQGCDPRNPTSSDVPFMPCQLGQTCAIWSGNSTCVVPTALGEVGDYCFDDDECGPGLGCGANGGFECARWCEIGSDECGLGMMCGPHQWLEQFGDTTAAGVQMGVCLSNGSQFDGENILTYPITDAVGEEPGGATSNIIVSGITQPVTDIVVEVNISHSWVGDVALGLVAPDGETVVILSTADLAVGGRDFISTVFTDSATTLISEAYAPFTGEFLPIDPLASFITTEGLEFNGTWSLVALDYFAGDTGSITSWRLTIY